MDEGLRARLESLPAGVSLAWAKTGTEDGNDVALWLPLVGHALDAGDVAGFLWDQWLSDAQKRNLSAPFRLEGSSRLGGAGTAGAEEEARARAFLRLAAALHDTGKLSPPFARQVTGFADRMRSAGLAMAPRDSGEAQRTRWFKHALAGSMILDRYGAAAGWDPGVRAALTSITGGHHGVPVDLAQRRAARDLPGLLTSAGAQGQTGDDWEEAQDAFIRFVIDHQDANWLDQPVAFDLPSLVLFQGLVTVSDWLASSSHYFPLTPASDEDFRYLAFKGQQRRTEEGLGRFNLPAPWVPANRGESATELLRSRFGVPFPARPLQDAAVAAARECASPCLMIIEDAMGAGKTEAALLAAEILAQRFGLTGLLVALPTQATTDAMFERLLKYLRVALADQEDTDQEDADYSVADGTAEAPRSVALLHGRAAWSEPYGALKRSGRFLFDRSYADFDIDLGGGAIEVDADEQTGRPRFASHPWMRGRYTAVLSSFVATTVDHLLMGALQMKQLPVRHLGLSGKVVIFDEAHASSDFMNFYAERVMEWLGAYSVPVIVLSATLTKQLRERLTSAYERGRESRQGERQASASEGLPGAPLPSPLPPPAGLGDASHDPAEEPGRERPAGIGETVPYPRLTWTDREGITERPVQPAMAPQDVTVRAAPPDASVAETVRSIAAGRQGNILVVCNTVREAQRTYEDLAATYGQDVRLAHARFTAGDRLRNDARLLELYGPGSATRPGFSILVGTQVVEQSLDIDFDVLVSQLAPVDLLLQRIGRIHRHAGRTRPEAFSKPTCHLTGVPTLTETPQLDPGSVRVYRAYKLLAAATVLGAALREPEGRIVHLPADIGALVERAASPGLTPPPAWKAEWDGAIAAEEAAQAQARHTVQETLVRSPDAQGDTLHPTLDGWLSFLGDPDSRDRLTRAKVREGVEDEEVILLNNVDGVFYTMPTPAHPHGVHLRQDVPPDYDTALQAALGTVRIPYYHCSTDQALDALEETWRDAWEQSPLLKGRLFLPLTDGHACFAGRTLRYSPDLGMEIEYDDR